MNYLKLMGLLSLTLVPLTTETKELTHLRAFWKGLKAKQNIIPGILSGTASWVFSRNTTTRQDDSSATKSSDSTSTSTAKSNSKKAIVVNLLTNVPAKIRQYPTAASISATILVDQAQELLRAKNADAIRTSWYEEGNSKILLPDDILEEMDERLGILNTSLDVEKRHCYRVGRALGTGAVSLATHKTLQLLCGILKR